MTQESSVPTGFQVVGGGSDDPFTKPVEESEDNPTTEEPTAGSQPGAGTTEPKEEGTGEGATPPKEGGLADLAEALKAAGWVPGNEVQGRISQVQSGWDARNAALEQQLKDEKAARLEEAAETRRLIQEARIEGLPEDEREQARNLFESEEAKRRQAELAQANDEYFKTVRAYDLSVRFSQFWPGDDDASKRTACEADLMGCEDVDQMATLANERKASYYEAIATGAAPSPAGDKGKTPAGATAPSDAGGSPPPPKKDEPLSGQSLDDMASNIKGMFGTPGSFN